MAAPSYNAAWSNIHQGGGTTTYFSFPILQLSKCPLTIAVVVHVFNNQRQSKLWKISWPRFKPRLGGLGNKTNQGSLLALPPPRVIIYCPTLIEVLEKFADRFPLSVSQQRFPCTRMHHPRTATAFPSARALPSTAASAHQSIQRKGLGSRAS